MLENRTVLVVGAGASKPYGFPLGSELRDAVIKAASDTAMSIVLRPIESYDNELQDFAADLAESGFSSVDAFLENRSEWTKIGKAALSLCLLSSEVGCKPHLFPPQQPGDHWYETLWSRVKGASWHAFKAQPLTIVTFNYDRSLDHYLVRVVANNFQLKPETVSRALPIIHLHGSLGPYEAFEFGSPITDDMHSTARRSIRIVHEADKNDAQVAAARDAIAAADRVLFLGFGYHPQNMSRLGFGSRRRPDNIDRLVLGTRKGLTVRHWGRICDDYLFSKEARNQGGASISDFISDWLE